MAVIQPFRGVRYNPACFRRLDDVVSQPYDRIGPDLAARYRQLSPYNITGIILGHNEDTGLPGPCEGEDSNDYRCARERYARWLTGGILIREEYPALYACEQTFPLAGRTHARLGLIAALRLHEFEEGVVLPHERTHSGPKADRLRLLRALQVQPEQIFVLYPDPENRVNAVVRAAIAGRAPDIDVAELVENQVRQRVWAITDPMVIRAVQAVLAPLRGLIIADGHHRYETALAYRREQQALHPALPPDAAVHYVSATLVSMDDPGLAILPTHREIHDFGAVAPAEVLACAATHFSATPAADLEATLAAVNAHPRGHAFGFYGGPEIGFHVLTLRDEAILDTFAPDRSREWRSLAVTIAHRLLLEGAAGVPAAGIEDKSLIRYHRDPQGAVDNIDAGRGEFAFFLSPTTMAQIKAVAARGETMPQKSTDFYPKMIAGLALLPVGPEERLPDPGPLASR